MKKQIIPLVVLLTTVLLFSSCGKGKAITIKIGDDSNDSEPAKEQKDEKADEKPQRLAVINVDYFGSLAPQGRNTYEPQNMLDGKLETAWAVNLDRASYDSDKLYGPTFAVRCKHLSYIVIRNGYGKDAASFRNNSRASKVIFYDLGKIDEYGEHDGKLFEGILKDTNDPQTLKIEKDLATTAEDKYIQMAFPVNGFYRGAKWNDLCISEIEFWGF